MGRVRETYRGDIFGDEDDRTVLLEFLGDAEEGVQQVADPALSRGEFRLFSDGVLHVSPAMFRALECDDPVDAFLAMTRGDPRNN
jgi:hypothetical protein